jgi:hypothetical protein
LNLHSEVKALQATLGISYKDAAHRLYMASVEKMTIEKNTKESLTNLRVKTEDTLKVIYPRIDDIDKGIKEEH